MGASIVIPKLGTITVPVRNAPLQIPGALPGWNTPKFINNTSNLQAPPAGFGGFYGLNYVYTNGQFTKNPVNVFDVVGSYQIAGGVVQSFGIFDFYAGPSLTGTKTSPYGGGGGENFANSWWAQGPNAFYLWRQNSATSGIWPGYIRVANFPLPNIMFGNSIQSANNADLMYAYSCSPPASGNLFAAPAPIFKSPIDGSGVLVPPARYANVNLGNPLAASGQVAVQPNYDPFHPTPPPIVPAGATAIAYHTQTGPITTAGAITPGIATWGTPASLTFSPMYNTFAGRHQTLGLIMFPLLITDVLLTQGNNQLAQHAVQWSLADAADQADMVSHSGIGGGWTVMPDGNFLIQSPNSLVSNYYVINPQGTGYYKMIVTGATAPGYNPASGGFGVDTNGNFWAFSANPTLVSNLGLIPAPMFQPYPQVTASWVGCRRNNCAYPWYG